MHNHDQEIIMALAEGLLSPTAAAAAEAEISACAECLRDLELQRIALATLADAPQAYLTATESARLHERLHEELAVSPPVPARSRSQLAWGRWVGLAVGTAAVFLAAFMVLPNMLSGDDDDSAEMVAFEQVTDGLNDTATETTSAAIEAAPPMREEMVGAADDLTLAGDGAASMTEAPAAETTAAPETTAGSTEDPSLDTANYLEYFAFGDLTEDLRLEILDQLEADVEFFRFGDENVKRINPDWELCVAATLDLDAFPADSAAQIVGMLVDDSGGDAGQELLLVAFVTADPNDTVLASIAIPECQVYQTLP
jgi:hypothetical protein